MKTTHNFTLSVLFATSVLVSYGRTLSTTPSTATSLSPSVTAGQSSVYLLGSGASLPSTLYYEWMALYSYTRQRQLRDSTIVLPSYTTYDSNLGKYVMFEQSEIYQYGATEIELNSFEVSMKPTLTMVPVVAG